MPAYWDLRAYGVDLERLNAFVGSSDTARAAKIAKAQTSRQIATDYRASPPGLQPALEEIAREALKKDHARAYRLALEAILEHSAPKIPHGTEGYAVRDKAPRALRVIGLNALADVWERDPHPHFPWNANAKKEPRGCEVWWPWATFIDHPTLMRAAAEITRSLCDEDELPSPPRRLIWERDSKKKKRLLLVELESLKRKKKTAKSKKTASRARSSARFALIKDGEPELTMTLEDALASVPTADFESAAMAASPKARQRIRCPALREGDRTRLATRIVRTMRLAEYDQDIVDVVFSLINIVHGCEAALDTLENAGNGNAENAGVILYADGEQ